MRCTCFVVIPLLLPSVALAQDVSSAANSEDGGKGQWVSLFDGKTLNGWKITGCEVVVEDGAIFLKSGNGLLRREDVYRDFVLEVEWKALKSDKWDSGIFIRCSDPPKGKPWPKTYQVNLRKGIEGNIAELKETRSTGLTKPSVGLLIHVRSRPVCRSTSLTWAWWSSSTSTISRPGTRTV